MGENDPPVTDSFSVLDLRSLALGVAFSGLFAYLAFRGVGFRQALPTTRALDPRFLAVGLLAMLTSLGIRAVRWRELLRPVAAVDVWALFQYNTLGWAMNFVLPVRSGELIKAVVAARREDRTVSFVLGTIGVLRVLDVVALFAILLASVVVLGVAVPDAVLYLGVVLVALGVGVTLFADRLSTVLEGNTVAFGRIDLSGITANVRLLSEGFATVRSPRQVVVTLALSFVLWGFDAAAYYAFLRAFGIELGAVGTAFLLSITSLGIALPSTAGHIGNFQFFATLALTSLGVARTTGLSFSIFLHAVQYVAVALFGVPFIVRYATDIWDILKRAVSTFR